MHRISIPRVDCGTADPDRPSWFGSGAMVFVRCGGSCGEAYRPDHVIEENGNLSPSLVCPTDGCGWHVWIRLDGWSGGRRARLGS